MPKNLRRTFICDGLSSATDFHLRQTFIRVRPIAQTIAAIATTIAAILRILKSLGF